MSGIELAGVTLALLPLLVSAAENYGRCAAPISRFKNFPKEVEQFLEQVDIQKLVFRNQCRVLLENVVDQDVARTMIQTAEHHSWHDIELEARLAQLMENTRGSCIKTMESIDEKLKAIESECQKLSASLTESDQSEKDVETKISRRSRIATKLGFSFSKSRLKHKLDDLQTYNHNFTTLVEKSFPDPHKRRPREDHNSADFKREIKRYVIVGKASRQVYEALSRSCTKHTEHLAHTCAEVECTSLSEHQAPRLRFRMAFSSSSDHKNPVSFMVDTTVEDLDLVPKRGIIVDLKGLEQSLKRQLDCPSDTAERKSKKSVRFESSAVRPTPVYPKSTVRDPISLDGCIKKDFCDHLRQCSNQGLHAEMDIGTPEVKTGCKRFVFPASTTSCSSRQEAVSLGHMISSLSEQTRRGKFPIYERLRLAKVLTIAVLQYHATPWLHGSWRSNDVTFLGEDAVSLLQRTAPLKAPHLYAKVKGSGSGPSSAVRGETEIASEAARNSLLYSLGILLLEIGYWKKWEDLSRSWESEDRFQNQYTQFFQARKFLKSGNSDMGPRYDGIVEQLIECDFGCGDDLSKDPLQKAVHRDVICELDELESGFRELQLGK